MRLEDLNWMDVESYLLREDRLMVPLGATEQHGYLSLATDTRIPVALADAASERTGVLVTPALPFGVSPYFAKYPGTISLRLSTYISILEDLVRWAHAAGFKRLLFLNGHGGNNPASAVLHELVNELPGLSAEWYAWWQSASVIAVAAKHGLSMSHASWAEAFSFTRVADLPAGGKPAVRARTYLPASEVREANGDGSQGGPYSAPEVVMDEVFAVALGDILGLLEKL